MTIYSGLAGNSKYFFPAGKITNLKSNKGLTLFELLIVIVIISLSLGIAGLYIGRGSGTRELKTFTRDISAVLRYARNNAVSEKKTACLVLDSEDSMIRLYLGDIGDDKEEELVPVLSRSVPEGIVVSLPDKRGDTQYIEFFPRGSSTGGVVEIENEEGLGSSIRINKITGKIDIVKKSD